MTYKAARLGEEPELCRSVKENAGVHLVRRSPSDSVALFQNLALPARKRGKNRESAAMRRRPPGEGNIGGIAGGQIPSKLPDLGKEASPPPAIGARYFSLQWSASGTLRTWIIIAIASAFLMFTACTSNLNRPPANRSATHPTAASCPPAAGDTPRAW